MRLRTRQYGDNRNRAIAYGTWQPWVDAEPVRIHIGYLRSCGMGLRAIAAAADVDRKRLQAIVTGWPARGAGPQAKDRPAIAAVLAVEPIWENRAPSTLISPLGTRRRAHALVAVGWPQQHLAARVRVLPRNFGQMLGREHVLVSRALAVRGMYDELWNADPAEYGATPGGIARARAYAAAYGWAPVGAWDDDTIDGPEAFPDWTGQCATPEGFWGHRSLQHPACPPCRAAFNAHQREQRHAQKGAPL
ncbi:hypothetical protein ACWGQ5_50460 [Streptomyces sp. NPDC055722]